MKKINLRGIIGDLLLISLIILLFSGIGLFLAPSGRIARESNWHFLLLDKFQWEDIHTYFGFLFVILTGFHLYFNRRPLLNYIRKRTKTFISLKKELAIAVVLSILFFWVFYKGLFPVPQVKSLQEYLKYGKITTESYSNNYYGGGGGRKNQ